MRSLLPHAKVEAYDLSFDWNNCKLFSSFSSFLNSMTAITWKDIFSKVPYCKRMSPESQGNVSRIIGKAMLIFCKT